MLTGYIPRFNWGTYACYATLGQNPFSLCWFMDVFMAMTFGTHIQTAEELPRNLTWIGMGRIWLLWWNIVHGWIFIVKIYRIYIYIFLYIFCDEYICMYIISLNNEILQITISTKMSHICIKLVNLNCWSAFFLKFSTWLYLFPFSLSLSLCPWFIQSIWSAR